MLGSGRIAARAAVLLAVVSLGACGGGSSPEEVVARVGDQAITKAALTHWITVLRGGTAVSDPPRGREQALRKRALQLLISSRWLIGEAASRGISISGPKLRRQIDRIEKVTFPGGVPELREFLKSTGQTVADVELQARDELVSAKLRRIAINHAPAVTQAQVAAYYSQHKRSFLIPERREARFTNRKTRAAAEKVKREVEAGKSLTSRGQREVGELFTGARVPPGDPYERAIDSAKPHVVAGPFPIGNDYWLYEVVKIIPARQQTLAQVGASIRKRLSGERRHRALADFVKAWTAQWTAKTDCSAGYVVQKCRQYRGAEVREDELRIQ